jgi:hypothetical protein
VLVEAISTAFESAWTDYSEGLLSPPTRAAPGNQWGLSGAVLHPTIVGVRPHQVGHLTGACQGELLTLQGSS